MHSNTPSFDFQVILFHANKHTDCNEFDQKSQHYDDDDDDDDNDDDDDAAAADDMMMMISRLVYSAAVTRLFLSKL